MDYELSQNERRFFTGLFGFFIILSIIIGVIAFFGKAHAQDMESAGNFYTKQFVVGSATQFTGHDGPLPGVPGVPRGDWGWGKEMAIDQVVTSSVDAYRQCLTEFGEACRIKVIGYSDGLAYGTDHDTRNGGLATQRAGVVGNSIRDQLGEEGSTAVLMEGAAEAREIGQRYVHVRVYVERAVPVSRGDGAPVAAPAPVPPPPPLTEKELWQTAAEVSRLLRDASDRKCPWQIEAVYHRESGLVTVEIRRLDPQCDCDGEGPYVDETTYENALKTEIGDRPLVYPDDETEALNHYDATRSVFTDQIGAEWNEGIFFSHGVLTVRKTANSCAEMEEAERLDSFFPGPFLGGSAEFGQSFILEGSPFEMPAGRDTAAYVEAGWVAGGARSAWLFGVGAGAAHDPNCLVPSHFSTEVFAGPWLSRHGHVSFLALGKWQYGFAPYNGEWIGTRHRFGVDFGAPLQLDIRLRPQSKLYVVPTVGIGFDLVSAEGPSGVAVTTERQEVVGGVRVLKTF